MHYLIQCTMQGCGPCFKRGFTRGPTPGSTRGSTPGSTLGSTPGSTHRVLPRSIAGVTLRFARGIAASLALSAVVAGSGCSSLTPVEKLVITQDAEPLLAQIRAGEVGIDDLLPWGGAFGSAPSYFTPLCAAAFVGSVTAVQELLLLGASVDAECSPSLTPLDLVMRHPSHQKASLLGDLLRSRGASARLAPDYVVQAGIRSPM